MDVGVLEAKNRLSELIERVERGERVVITRHGKPVATLNSAQGRPSLADVERIIAEVADARSTLPKISTEDTLEILREGREERYRRIFDR
jgi:prevent-host-death family protein